MRFRNPDARFDAEEVIVNGSRVTVLSIHGKMRNGQPWHLRGVDDSYRTRWKRSRKARLCEGLKVPEWDGGLRAKDNLVLPTVAFLSFRLSGPFSEVQFSDEECW